MCRYLVCSDIHLNISRRFNDTVDALGQVIEIAQNNLVDKVFVLGDVYTSRRPHSKERSSFEKWAKSITDPYKLSSSDWKKIELHILKGNHDEYPDGTHSFSEFTELDVDRVRVHDNPSVVDGFFLGHLLLREARLGPLDYQSSDSMSVEELIQKYPKCKAYLLGDVHKAQVLKQDPFVAYAGSISRVDFGERDDVKSVMIIDDLENRQEIRTELLKSRTMAQFTFDGPPYERREEQDSLSGSIVKLIVRGTPDEIKEVDEIKLRRDYKEVDELIIQYDVQNEIVARDRRVTENVTPYGALKLYLEKLDLQTEERHSVLELGQKVIDDACAEGN